MPLSFIVGLSISFACGVYGHLGAERIALSLMLTFAGCWIVETAHGALRRYILARID